MKYRKRPVEVDAILYDGQNVVDCVKFAGQENVHQFGVGQPMVLRTLEGNITASIGDWIVRGVAGEVYPVKPDTFMKTYEPAALLDHEMDFGLELRDLLNRYNRESESDTPDFILRDFLLNALKSFDAAVGERERWYGREAWPQEPIILKGGD